MIRRYVSTSIDYYAFGFDGFQFNVVGRGRRVRRYWHDIRVAESIVVVES